MSTRKQAGPRIRPQIRDGGGVTLKTRRARRTWRHLPHERPMRTPDPLVTIRRMFEALRAGDLDALVATVHPDSDWTYIGANPRRSRAHFRGREAVRAFFERILSRLDMQTFTATDTVVDGQTVVVFGFEEGEVRSTRARFRNEWVQKYMVEDGLIVEMVELNVQVEPGERDTRPATGTGATAPRNPSE